MLNREWEKDYQSLLDKSRSEGEVKVLEEGAEKRESPRFKLKSGTVWIQLNLSFDVVDISVSGISFYSTQRFEKEQVIAITLGKAFRIETEVVDCGMVESDVNFLEIAYLVRCRFKDETSAMRFLVMRKEVNDPEFDFSSD